MPALNNKPVRLLMRDMATAFNLQPGDTFSREQAVRWFQEHYPNVKEGTVTAHLSCLSTNSRSRVHFTVKEDGSDDVFFKVDSRNFRLYEKGRDPTPIYASTPSVEESDTPDVPDVPTASEEFAYEHDLRDYLARNLQVLEPSLRLYAEDGITGVEFPVGGRSIDILAVDKAGDYVVIELKVSKGYDRTVGQLLRYVGWIKRHHAEPGRGVRGMIVAKQITEDLRLACADQPHVQLYEYKLAVTAMPVAAA